MVRVTGYIEGEKYEGVILDKNGNQKCPICPLRGKKNTNATPLSVNTQKKAFNCHKCSWSGYYGNGEQKMQHENNYEKPDIGNQTDLNDKTLQYFSKRLIYQQELIRNKVKSVDKNWFAYTFYDGNEPVKVKYKSLPDKDGKKMLRSSKNSKPWIYKYNDVVGQKEVIICEGEEEETLVWEHSGFKNACSVDMGAPNPNDKNKDGKLQCITNCFDVFENAETIYIAVDNDENGKALEKELIRRFGAEKCKIVDFKDVKDANDFAVKYGFEQLREQHKNAKDVKVDGVFELNDFKDEILHDWKHGQPLGTTTYFENVDSCWKWRLGEVNIWSGYNNEGKSLLLKQFQIAKSLGEGWKHAVFSPEEAPLKEWYTDLIESFVGKSADSFQERYGNYMNKMEIEQGMTFIDKHFFSVLPEKDYTLESLLEKFSYTVRKFNVKTVTFDPYNQIEHLMKQGEREDLYISRFMTSLKRFATEHNVSVNLIAHQVTPTFKKGENYPEPNLYKVKGGGTFADKADNVLMVWRENRNTDITDNTVTFISQKIKKQKLTGIPGRTELLFDKFKNRYFVDSVSPIETLRTKVTGNQEEIGFFDNLKVEANAEF